MLSDALHVFYEIKKFMCITTISSYPNDKEEKFGSLLDDRQKMCCQSMHLVMSVSNSRCDSMHLIPEDYQLAIDFLIKFSNSVSSAENVADFVNFQAKEGLYSNDAT